MGSNKKGVYSDPSTRFHKHYKVVESGCWEWQSHLSYKGYGMITDKTTGKSKSVKAHRLSYLIHVGEIPSDKIICHKCNNKRCVNPDHLYAGTYEDNYQDAVRAGTTPQRTPKPPKKKGELNFRRKLTTQQVVEIRTMLNNGYGCERLGKMYKVDKKTIADIKHYRSYKEILILDSQPQLF